MGTATSTGTLTAGNSRTFSLAPASAVTLTTLPNCRVTVTESPATVTATGLGGNATRTHHLRLPQTVTYGPYPMGGEVVVENDTLSGSTVSWVETAALLNSDRALIAGDGSLLRPGVPTNPPRRGFPLAAQITSASGVTVAGQSASSPVVTYVERDGLRGIRVTTAVGLFAEISVPAFSRQFLKGQVSALFYVPDGEMSKLSTTALYVGTSAYAAFYVESINHQSAGCNQHPGWYTLAPDPATSPADTVRTEWAVGGGSPDFASTTFVAAKFRVTPLAGQTATVELYGIWGDGSSPLPKCVFTVDDGYDSQYSIGIPVFDRFGHKVSMSIIADAVGTAGYMTVAQLQELVGRGHECVVHGPTGLTGNLTTRNVTEDDVFNDVNYHQRFLVNNGLSNTYNSHQVYVYPQGVYRFAADDTKISNALSRAGFVAARCANVNQSSIEMAHAGRLPMFIPIIGHTWVDAPSEAANVARLIAKMQEAATQGRSVVFMFHKFTAGAAADALEIASADLTSICAALAELQTDGLMENATLAQFAEEIRATVGA